MYAACVPKRTSENSEFIDEAIMVEAHELHILHGKGNGILRELIAPISNPRTSRQEISRRACSVWRIGDYDCGDLNNVEM